MALVGPFGLQLIQMVRSIQDSLRDLEAALTGSTGLVSPSQVLVGPIWACRALDGPFLVRGNRANFYRVLLTTCKK